MNTVNMAWNPWEAVYLPAAQPCAILSIARVHIYVEKGYSQPCYLVLQNEETTLIIAGSWMQLL